MGFETPKPEQTTSEVADAELQALQSLLKVQFALWSRKKDGTYQPLDSHSKELDTDVVAELCEAAMFESMPPTKELPGGKNLLAFAWPEQSSIPKFATCEVSTENLELACRLIELAIKQREQTEELRSLREENSAYLRQLNEDMEELVFLRNMAEKLALGTLTSSPNDLLEYVLTNLGEAAGVEEVHFVEGVNHETHVTRSWILPSCENRIETSLVENLVKNLSPRATDIPLVTNLFDKTTEGEQYPGVREFALVAVTTNNVTIGWLVAINRHVNEADRHEHPVWKLGNNEIGSCEVSLMSTSAAMLASYIHNTTLLEERESLLLSVVRTLVSAIESRDLYTCGHSERVARYARRLAKEFEFDREGCRMMYLTGLLHDIGKIGLSDSVLKKTGPLTDEEFAEIKKHPDLGWAILRELDSMDYVLPGVLHHHERWDGKGYPDNLQGDQTPLEGRLLAVVDAFDAMTSDRPYRKGMDWERAVAILMDGAGSQWDADVIDKFVAIMPDIINIQQNYRRPPPAYKKARGTRRSARTWDGHSPC